MIVSLRSPVPMVCSSNIVFARIDKDSSIVIVFKLRFSMVHVRIEPLLVLDDRFCPLCVPKKRGWCLCLILTCTMAGTQLTFFLSRIILYLSLWTSKSTKPSVYSNLKRTPRCMLVLSARHYSF